MTNTNISLLERLDRVVNQIQQGLWAQRNEEGYWEGELASSSLSTATAVVALDLVDSELYQEEIGRGVAWLAKHQNEDGGWGDTTQSLSNLSTTLLVWSALQKVLRTWKCACPDRLVPTQHQQLIGPIQKGNHWIEKHVGSLKPDDIVKAVVLRYGKDKTFSVPILMLCALCGTLGEKEEAWRRVLTLPFELAALPRNWFGAVGLPVVSYALPALIAIGYARYFNAPPSLLNPLRALRGALWHKIRPMLATLQPESGGYLEATPLTSFVTMALAGAQEKHHPCVPPAVKFLRTSQREDGSWPIDTNLATWVTTLSTRALLAGEEGVSHSKEREVIRHYLLGQQYQEIHPFTNAAPGAWAWTHLSGGVPDADDTSGALVALRELEGETPSEEGIASAQKAIRWLLDLQNRDGGMPTFCRGWGTLPFDRSTAEITAHALYGCLSWEPWIAEDLKVEVASAKEKAIAYLAKSQQSNGSWIPLWFGNERAQGEENPVHGTSMVLIALCATGLTHLSNSINYFRAVQYLLYQQNEDGSWGGEKGVPGSIEETANALNALSAWSMTERSKQEGLPDVGEAISKAGQWLLDQTKDGTEFEARPIGLYFAKLWYHERLYPQIWTLAALKKWRLSFPQS